MYQRFTALADRKKGLRNDEIAALSREARSMRREQPRLVLRTENAARKPILSTIE